MDQLNTVPATSAENVTAVAFRNSQLDWSNTDAILGVGFTRMLKLIAGPKQVLLKGRTVKLEITGIFPGLVAVNAAILPMPVSEANPMEGMLCCHWYSVPSMNDPVKLIGPINVLLQLITLLSAFTRGVDLTSMVKLMGEPGHPDKNGVTTKLLVTGTLEKLLAMKELTCPLPEPGKPFAGSLFVQL
ncbi:MAG: hypothetical protein ACK52I_13450 [Pseudomonadota bacterium]